MDTIQILLIEDSRLLQDGITALLHRQADFEVVARSGDGDAVRQLKSLDVLPDIVLLDLGLKKMNSLKLMALLKEEIPDAKIIAMDILPDHVNIIEFVKAGGQGFILKNAPPEDWIRTIKAVASGQRILPPLMTRALFKQIMTDQFNSGKEILPKAIQLTLREREVVNLIAEGLSNKEIAITLHIATYTVKSHVHNILDKLTLRTRLQIAAYVRNEEN